MTELHITAVDNGYHVLGDNVDVVIEINYDLPDGEAQRDAMTRLFEKINEELGSEETRYDGFSKTNLRINWDKKGDEVE